MKLKVLHHLKLSFKSLIFLLTIGFFYSGSVFSLSNVEAVAYCYGYHYQCKDFGSYIGAGTYYSDKGPFYNMGQSTGNFYVYTSITYSTDGCITPARWDSTSLSCIPPCPDGQTRDSLGICLPNQAQKNAGSPPTCNLTNPVNGATGNKYQVETDYVGVGQFPLEFKRHYNSDYESLQTVGSHWRHTYERQLIFSGTKAAIVRPDGRAYSFVQNGTDWLPSDADINDKLVAITGGGWQLTLAENDTVEDYDSSQRLTKITLRNGSFQQLSYDTQGRLSTVDDGYGHILTFSYDAIVQNRLVSVTDPAGNLIQYGYNATGDLTSVTYPDATIRQYFYDEAAYSASAAKHKLTGITDENNVRFSIYRYDSQGRGISTEHAGGVEKTSLVYNADGSTSVTDVRGTLRTYQFQNFLGVLKNTSVSLPCSCGGALANSYDANGNITSRTDFNGNVTTYTYDTTRNLETSRTEASGTALERTITTTWHSTFHLPATITEPNRVTTFTYDSQGNLTKRMMTSGALTRTWKYTYNANGQVTSVDEPRGDVTNITRYTYYPATGNLASVKNPLGHITSFASYNANAQPLRIVDANGVVTLLSYDTRGRLLTRSVGGEVTSYSYDGVGQLLKITFPDASFINYFYDDAHRLIQETDNLGNSIVYTLDAMGNRLKIDSKNPDGTIAQTRTQEFDELNRLKKSIGAQGQTTLYGYDSNDNLTSVTDALNQTSSSGYDALNRLTSNTNSLLKVTQYQYDANDNLKKVSDPRNVATQYVYDGLGNQLQTLSQDTGTTTNTFDAAGNLLTSTDARGQATTYIYDALNRVTQISFSSGSPITFTYDTGTYGVGHLTGMSDETGSTAWTYTNDGRVASKTQTIGTVSQTTNYVYNVRGQLVTMTYPSGNALTFLYNAAGQLARITLLNQAIILKGASYTPFHEVKSWIFGNNQTYQRSFDQDGRVTQYPLSGSLRSLSYDATDRITDYTHTDTTLNQHFVYDAVDQLTGFTRNSAVLNYAYDSNGNRLKKTTQTTASFVTDYSYAAASNRLLSIATTGAPTLNVSYDTAGNTLDDGKNTYVYNARGRLVQATSTAGTTQYSINGLGQRVRKVTASGETWFVYDEAGHLLGEYTSAGVPIQETVYLGDKPVAVIKGTSISYIYADHLNAPRVITDTANKNIWQWNADPFGVTLADSDPDGDGVQFMYNLRFPGQYYDGETGLHYNYFRDYNPSTGRYLESDPIGLRGGLNTFGYAYQNPMMFTDPTGLIPGAVCDANGCKTLDDDCDCLAKAFLGWEDLTVVGAAAATGPTLQKPRGGIAGGGPSGSRTSPLSRMIHEVNKRVGKSAATAAVRNVGRFVFRVIPGVGAAVMLYDIAVYNECMQKCKKCQK